MPNRPATDDLALTALRYAAGELPPECAAVFEDRLAADQEAREALGEAIRLSAAALGRPAPAPDRLVREAVRDDLRPTLLSRLFPRRPYRGHPLTWAGLGGGVAAALTVFGVWLGDPPEEDPAPITAVAAPPPAELARPATVHIAASQPAEERRVYEAPPPRPVEPPAVAHDPDADWRIIAIEEDEPKRAAPPERANPGRASEPKAAVPTDGGPR